VDRRVPAQALTLRRIEPWNGGGGAKAKREPALVWRPQDGPQAAFVTSPVFDVVYGGARGGGKTDAALGEFGMHAQRCGAAAKGLLVRRTRVALEPTMRRARQIYHPAGALWHAQKSAFQWPSGAVLYLRHLDRDSDADAFQGHDYSRVYVEELTQFPDPRPVDKLKATLRSAAGVVCAFRATCNPGGPGHTPRWPQMALAGADSAGAGDRGTRSQKVPGYAIGRDRHD